MHVARMHIYVYINMDSATLYVPNTSAHDRSQFSRRG